MGQKVHPIGFRVGITKPYQSQWFARFHKFQYSQTVIEDRLLRQTLMTLFPKLLNSKISATKKKDKNVTLSPKITHIKIERGLIPYQIGLHIHAENCDMMKSAIENLKVTSSLETNLQKARRYLSLLKQQPSSIQGDLQDFSEKGQKNQLVTKQISGNSPTNTYLPLGSVKKELTGKDNNKNRKIYGQKNIGPMMKRKKRISQKRVRTKSSIMTLQKSKASIGSDRMKESQAGQFYFQIGMTKTIGFSSSKPKGISLQKTTQNRQQKNSFNQNRQQKNSFLQLKLQQNRQSKNTFLQLKLQQNRQSKGSLIRNLGTASWNQTANKIFDLFLKKTKKNFFRHLKEQIKHWNEQTRGTPLGSNKKWNFRKSVITVLNNKPISKLIKLFLILKKKALVKMDSLRNDFISSGSLSKAQTFGYYQILKFLINLRKYIKKRSLQGKNLKEVLSQNLFNGNSPRSRKLMKENLKISYSQMAINQRVIAIQQKLTNIEEECRKIKFIEYLKELVKKHREKNVFYYLPTIIDSKKNLRQIQQLTKRNANFLFGLDSKVDGGHLVKDVLQPVQLANNNLSVIRDQIKQALEPERNNNTTGLSSEVASITSSTQEANNFKTSELQKVFLKQLEKQKKINKENCELTPKISLKFYTANSSIIETKATIVADAVVDSLEKRQSFRKVIKQAMSFCMKNPRVKGVKIQIAGRLNGAEIARTEWVRSGRVPLQTLTANIDYSYKTASTIYGIIGIKVWIFKGYTKIL